MAVIDQIQAIDNQITAKQAEIVAQNSSGAAWRDQAVQPCSYTLKARQNECLADRAAKAQKSKDAFARANFLQNEVANLEAQKVVLEKQLETEKEIARTLAAQGKTVSSVETSARLQAEAQAGATIQMARAAADAQTAKKTAEIEADNSNAKFMNIAKYVGLGLAAVFLAVFIYKKLLKK